MTATAAKLQPGTAAEATVGPMADERPDEAADLRARVEELERRLDKVYEQYKLAPQVTKRRMYYETMERVLANVDKTIVEAPGVNSYLPLGELKRSVPKEPAQ